MFGCFGNLIYHDYKYYGHIFKESSSTMSFCLKSASRQTVILGNTDQMNRPKSLDLKFATIYGLFALVLISSFPFCSRKL